jgi:hypothetical protein
MMPMFWLHSVLFFLCALHWFLGVVHTADADSLLALQDLPVLQQNHSRVLAVITGDWEDHAPGALNLDLLPIILYNYVQLCEHGMEVHVVLSTYKEQQQNWTLSLPPHQYMCYRTGTLLPVAIVRHTREPLPKGTYGTGGTLASKHRKIFTRMMSKGYDLFNNQEDDIIIKPHTFRYFMQHAARAYHKGWYLAMMETEVPVQTFDRNALTSVPSVFVDWRVKRFNLISIDGQVWMDFMEIDQRQYMLTRSMLLGVLAKDPEWDTRSPPEHAPFGHWEYNPYYNQGWLSDFFPKRVIPVRDLSKSYTHHASDRYWGSSASWDGNMSAVVYAEETMNPEEDRRMMHAVELEAVLLQCMGPFAMKVQAPEIRSQLHYKVHFVPAVDSDAPCKKCIDDGMVAQVQILISCLGTLANGTYSSLDVCVKLHCE